jgi:hypothetical protein
MGNPGRRLSRKWKNRSLRRSESYKKKRDWRLVNGQPSANRTCRNSVSDEKALWFLATDLVQGEANPEGSEVLETRRVSLDEALDMIERHEITDALAIIALLHYARMKSRGQR